MRVEVEQSRLRNYLGTDESVEYTYQNYNVTNKRLIMLKRGGFQDVAFHHITSLNYDSKPRKSLTNLGALSIAAGIFYFIYATAGNSINTNYMILAIVVGALLIALGQIFRIRRYIMHTSGGEDFEVPGNGPQTETFLRIIREHMK